jgi:hypothetical protein
MDDRSSRVTRLAPRVLSANEIAGALISMMARSTTPSDQRPGTLMQDRTPDRRKSLATHGGTIHSGQLRRTQCEHMFSALPQLADSLDDDRPFRVGLPSPVFRRMRPTSLKYPNLNSNRARTFTTSRTQSLLHQPKRPRSVRTIISLWLIHSIRGDQISIARVEPPNSIARGFLPWRFSNAGPAPCRALVIGPAFENLHNNRHCPLPHRYIAK